MYPGLPSIINITYRNLLITGYYWISTRTTLWAFWERTMSYVITYFLGLYITTWECAGHVGRKQGIRGERRDRVETVKRKTPTRKTLYTLVQ